MSDELVLSELSSEDWLGLWPSLREVFAAGETYAVERDVTEAAARTYWWESAR